MGCNFKGFPSKGFPQISAVGFPQISADFKAQIFADFFNVLICANLRVLNLR